jgi:hypothetical protein
LPQNYKRMLLTTNVYRRLAPTMPMRFISEQDEWVQRSLAGHVDGRGEWILQNGRIYIRPTLGVGDDAIFFFLQKEIIAIGSGGFSDAFLTDGDLFRIDERVLKLGMIWSWKQLKGSPYAEDMANYQDALSRVAGADSPAPIILGTMPSSTWVGGPYPHAF